MTTNQYNGWGSFAGESLNNGKFYLSESKSTNGKDSVYRIILKVSLFEFTLVSPLTFDQCQRLKTKISNSIRENGCFGLNPSQWIKTWEQ